MIGRFTQFFSSLTLVAISVCAVWADPPTNTQPPSGAVRSLVVLRNGEVFSGVVSRQGDRYVIAGEGTEIRLTSRDVDFLCQTLDEAYNVQHSRLVAGRIEDRLNLADWCLRQKLFGDAAREITAAMEIDPKNPRVAVLDAQLQRAMQPEAPKEATADATDKPQPVSADELERMVRSLPPATVETFTSTIQPLVLNYCATAGCHGPSSQSSFTLVRLPYDKIATRRLTERNLYNTLQWINHENPLDSKLLSAAREPHGPHQASGATGVGTTQYQQLMNWVLLASYNNAAALQAKAPASVPAATFPLATPVVLTPPAASTTWGPNNLTPTPPAVVPPIAGTQASAPGTKPAIAKIRRVPNAGAPTSTSGGANNNPAPAVNAAKQTGSEKPAPHNLSPVSSSAAGNDEATEDQASQSSVTEPR
jgi:hypothetical protein